MTTTTTTKLELTIPQATLASGLRSVVYAADDESSRYTLGGVRVVVMPGEVTFIATDGRRMSWRRFECDHGLEPIEFTIPLKEAKALSRIPTKKNAVIVVDIDPIRPVGNQWDAIHEVIVNWTNGKKQTKQTKFEPLRGRYPKWQDIVTNAKEQKQKQIGQLSGPADMLLKFFEPEQGITIEVNGSAKATGLMRQIRGERARIRKPNESIKHDGKFSVCVNRELIADVLSACGESEAVIRVSDPNRPVLIECENGLSAVVMPMQSK